MLFCTDQIAAVIYASGLSCETDVELISFFILICRITNILMPLLQYYLYYVTYGSWLTSLLWVGLEALHNNEIDQSSKFITHQPIYYV